MESRDICVLIHFASTAIILRCIQLVFPTYTSCFLSIVTVFPLWVLLSYWTLGFTKKKYLSGRLSIENKAVFITGCDTGFGHLLAKRLDSRGIRVFAGCLLPSGAGAKELEKACSQNLRIVPLDVTDADSVKNAVDDIKNNLGEFDLWAVVNNAGIRRGLSVDLTSLSIFQNVMDTNCMGTIRVTKECLPLLKKSKGRVVNVTSIGGHIALPFVAPYITSKFAAVGFTECLRHELQQWEISVISIEPEAFATKMTDTGRIDNDIHEVFSSLDDDTKATYGEEYFKLFIEMKKWVSVVSPKLELVVDDMESAITLAYPSSRYRTRRNCFMALGTRIYETMPYSWQALFMTGLVKQFNPGLFVN